MASTPSSSLPSSSTWQWKAEFSLFFNPARNLWAQYDAQTGEYIYLPSDLDLGTSTVQEEKAKEEGEISDEEAQRPPLPSSSSSSSRPLPSTDYDDPSLYAFPSTTSSRPPTTTTGTTQSTLRLLLVSSSCLPPTQKLALLSSLQPDGYTLGRDKQLSPEEGRIRLREMEVSKSHAIVYHTVDDAVEAEAAAYVDRDAWGGGGEEVEGRAWDKGKGTGGKWWIVDSGSMHGTYLKKGKEREKVEDGGGGLGYDGEVGTKSKGGGKKEKGQRLSESKTASLPARLEHGDLLSVGSTIFEVHLHPNFPCTQCSSTTTSSLIPTSFAPDSSSQLSDASSSWKSILDREHGPQLLTLNPREKLKRLKEELLSKDSTKRTESHSSSSTSNEEEGERRKEREYQDRAALRREIYPDEPLPPPITSYSKKRKPNPTSLSAPPKPPAAQTSYSALPSTNVGHAMLLKKGWNPGSALGLAGEAGGGQTEPLQVKRLAGEGRKGLGVKSVEVNGEEEGEWRERGKSKRWKEEMGLL